MAGLKKTLLDIKACLDSEVIPKVGNECDYCTYREAAGKALAAQHMKTVKPSAPVKKPPVKKESDPSDASSPTASLF
jgi:hypothetical protein